MVGICVGTLTDWYVDLLRVPFTERVLAVLLDLLSDNSCWSALVIGEGNAVLPYMRRRALIVAAGRRNKILTASFESREPALLHPLAARLDAFGALIGVHRNFLGRALAQLRNLIGLQVVLAHCDSLRDIRMRLKGPLVVRIRVSLRVVKAIAVDLSLAPNLAVRVFLPVVSLSHLFAPLVHLHFALQAVRILDLNREVFVHHCLLRDSIACHVHKFEVICVIRLFRIDRHDGLAALHDQLCESHNFLLVVPENHKREWYQEHSNDEPTDS